MCDRIKTKKSGCCGTMHMYLTLTGIHGDSEMVISRQKKSSLCIDAAGMG